MGLASFLMGREVSRTQLGAFTVDCTISMSTSMTADLTKNPIQDGSKITDHVSLNPIVFKIEGFISESPIGGFGDEASALVGGALGGLLGSRGIKDKVGGAGMIGAGLGATIGAGLVGKIGSVYGDALGIRSDPGSYPRIAMMSLINMYEQRSRFIIKTFFHKNEKNNIYTNMVITSLDFPQTAKEGNSLKFNLTAERLTIVSLQSGKVDGNFMKGLQAANSAESKKDLGRQGAEQPKASSENLVSKAYTKYHGAGN